MSGNKVEIDFGLSDIHKAFADRYLANGMNATEAMAHAYNHNLSEKYNHCNSYGCKLLKDDAISAYIRYHTRRMAMPRDEWLMRQAHIARFDPSPYLKRDGTTYYLDIDLLKADGFGWMIAELGFSNRGDQTFKFLDRQKALDSIGKALGLNRVDVNITGRDRVIAMLQDGKITADAVQERWPTIASQLFAEAGIKVDESTE